MNPLEYVYNSLTGYIIVRTDVTDCFSPIKTYADVGYFEIGDDSFYIASATNFLTANDMKSIINKMEEYK